MKVFEPAAERSTSANLARTLGQTIFFWVVFIGVTPWLILRLERELGAPTFTFVGQDLVALAIGLVGAAFNLWSGVMLAVISWGDSARAMTISARMFAAGARDSRRIGEREIHAHARGGEAVYQGAGVGIHSRHGCSPVAGHGRRPRSRWRLRGGSAVTR